jgi:hypothetical protein
MDSNKMIKSRYGIFESRSDFAKYLKFNKIWTMKEITPEYRKKMSEACSGEKNGMFNKKQTDNTKKIISEKAIQRCQDKEYISKITKSAIKSSINRWKDPVYKNKQLKALKNAKRTYVRTREHQEKINNSLKGSIPWNKGYGEYIRGSKNPMYINGESIKYPIIFNKYLRQEIRKRDEYICKICFKKQENRLLSVHHIDWNKKNNKTYNLISLCASCHQRLHANKIINKILFSDNKQKQLVYN